MSAAPPPLALYAAASGLLEPLAPALLRARARRGKEDPARLSERLGRPGAPRPEGPLAWLHAASVGESLSLLPLVEGLSARRPGLRLLVTSGTTTSADLLARRLPAGVIHQFVPVDGPAAARRFLDHWRPSAAFFVESELWPNLILGARRRGARLALVSARMTEGSARSWGRMRGSAEALLATFDVILPQDAATERRLQSLGARTGPRLNLKLVGSPLPCDEDALAALRGHVGGRRVVLAASTHAGEEAFVARAVADAFRGRKDVLLIVVPRHPARGADAAAALAEAGLLAGLRSMGDVPDARAAYVADTLGELGLFLRVAGVAVMGGAFYEGIGGHNPLEPARLGAPVLTGPHAFNSRELYDEMFAWAAAIEARDETALVRHLRGLMENPQVARRMGEAGLAYADSQGQALGQALDLLEPLLP